jgi:HDOD domain-containing protein
MHDLGRLGLLMSVGQRYREALAKEVGDLNVAIRVEAALFGMDHCDAGAMLAHTWGFPATLQVAMLEHHDDPSINSKSRIALVQTACRVADWLGFPEVKRIDLGMPPPLPQHVVESGQLDPTRVVDLIKKQAASLGF